MLLLVMVHVAVAQFGSTDIRVTDTLTHGSIHWTEGLARSWGKATGAMSRGSAGVTSQAAAQAARQELVRLFGQIRLDATQTLEQAVRLVDGRQQALEILLEQATVAETRYGPGGTVETAVQMAFAGGFMALFLPPTSAAVPESPAGAAAVHTGVMIDARGLAIQAALFPNIVDEQGQPLYTPERVEREAAIQQGYMTYARAFDQAPVLARIGENPLVVRALRVASATRVDLVLSQAEASRLRDYAATYRLLRQCRVVILM
jgi:hypothetical protein